MLAPKELLPKCVNQQIKVITTNQTYYTGKLISYDEYMNLVLSGDVEERKLTSKGELLSKIGGDNNRVLICGVGVAMIVPCI